MALILIRYSEYAQESGALKKAQQILPRIVSDCLSVSGEGKLIPADVDIWSLPCSGEDCDPNDSDLQVVIFADLYPERVEVLQKAEEKIQQRLTAKLPARIRGYVWILLCPAAFGEFETRK